MANGLSKLLLPNWIHTPQKRMRERVESASIEMAKEWGGRFSLFKKQRNSYTPEQKQTMSDLVDACYGNIAQACDVARKCGVAIDWNTMKRSNVQPLTCLHKYNNNESTSCLFRSSAGVLRPGWRHLFHTQAHGGGGSSGSSGGAEDQRRATGRNLYHGCRWCGRSCREGARDLYHKLRGVAAHGVRAPEPVPGARSSGTQAPRSTSHQLAVWPNVGLGSAAHRRFSLRAAVTGHRHSPCTGALRPALTHSLRGSQ